MSVPSSSRPAPPPALLLAVLSALSSPHDRDDGLAVVRRGGEWVVGVSPEQVVTASGPDELFTADSDPGAEWGETELKASRLLAAAGLPARAPVGAALVGAG